MEDYNLKAIRELIYSLTDEEFNDLVFYSFNHVYKQFTEKQTKPLKIRNLIEYIDKHKEIEKLLDEIKEINPKAVNNFESSIGRGDTNLSNFVNQEEQAINDLREYLQNKPLGKLKDIYLDCHPKKADIIVNNIEDILTQLNRLIPTQKYRPILLFVEKVQQDFPDLEMQLKCWLDVYGNFFGYAEFNRTRQQTSNQPSLSSQNDNPRESYLLIELNKRNYNSLQIQGWFCSYNNNELKPKIIQIQEKDTIKLKSTDSEFQKKYYHLSEKITELIEVSNKKMGKIGSGDLRIELFLSIDLLTESDFYVEWLKIKKGWLTPVMCRQYTVNFRLAERLRDESQDLKGAWGRKWKKLNSNNRIVVDYCYNIDCQLELDETVGIKLDRASNQAEFFEKIYLKALPIALWSRRDLQTISCQNEINRILNSEAVQSSFYQLPQEVKNERNNAVGKEHIGHHICLLWDDPNRIPPNPGELEYALNSM